MSRPAAGSIDDYIADFPDGTREKLSEIRNLIKSLVPDATETISYAIPTFDRHGKHLVHFAGFKNHIGFYPTPSGLVAFADELAPYLTGKGTAQFPLDKPLPIDLIRKVVEFRLAESEARAAK